MSTTSLAKTDTLPPSELHPGEQRIVLHGVTWEQHETIAAAFEDIPGVRLTYLERALEIMTASFDHEGMKKCIARLLEAYAEEKGISLNGFGEVTLASREAERKLEPDECYFVGPRTRSVPELAIEVALSSGLASFIDPERQTDSVRAWRAALRA